MSPSDTARARVMAPCRRAAHTRYQFGLPMAFFLTTVAGLVLAISGADTWSKKFVLEATFACVLCFPIFTGVTTMFLGLYDRCLPKTNYVVFVIIGLGANGMILTWLLCHHDALSGLTLLMGALIWIPQTLLVGWINEHHRKSVMMLSMQRRIDP